MYEDEIPVGRAENLTNKRFGRWTVLYRAKGEGNSSYWKCRCDCGTERVVRKQQLKNGRSQSCGCLHKEIVTNYHLLDITGQRFGNLVAIKPTKEKLGTSVIWECQCDCGNICTVSSNNLIQGKTASCGCEKSYGEIQIVEALKRSDWVYKREYWFSDLRGDNLPLRFDFAIFKNNDLLFLIEFQGEQHFYPNEFFGGIEQFNKQQDYDKRKVDYCNDNHIPLIIIPYQDKDKITLEYIKEKYYDSKKIPGYSKT